MLKKNAAAQILVDRTNGAGHGMAATLPADHKNYYGGHKANGYKMDKGHKGNQRYKKMGYKSKKENHLQKSADVSVTVNQKIESQSVVVPTCEKTVVPSYRPKTVALTQVSVSVDKKIKSRSVVVPTCEKTIAQSYKPKSVALTQVSVSVGSYRKSAPYVSESYKPSCSKESHSYHYSPVVQSYKPQTAALTEVSVSVGSYRKSYYSPVVQSYKNSRSSCSSQSYSDEYSHSSSYRPYYETNRIQTY
jgi:hypothetical protein